MFTTQCPKFYILYPMIEKVIYCFPFRYLQKVQLGIKRNMKSYKTTQHHVNDPINVCKNVFLFIISCNIVCALPKRHHVVYKVQNTNADLNIEIH